MTVNICNIEYKLDVKIDNALDVLNYIKINLNNSLSYKYSCKSGVCGSCSVRINGLEKLACCSKINDNDKIEPLNNLTVIRDLVVDNSNIQNKLLQSKAQLENINDTIILHDDIHVIDLHSNCILCNSCYSACPVYDVNADFIGPFALARVYRYVQDKKELLHKDKLDAIQESGIWDCTLCGNCDSVCPANITIKNDILLLQNISIQNGYENPVFSSNTNNFNSFDDDFGFNPNGF